VQGQTFDRYLHDGEPLVTADIVTGDRPIAEWDVSQLIRYWDERDGRVLHVQRTEWTASLDLDGRTVDAKLEGPWPLGFGSLLKLITQAYSVASGRGVVLHAASVEHEGAAYVFMGPSGAGKTTVAMLSHAAGMNALSEEMTFVSTPESQERPRVFTLPFRQRGGLRPQPAQYPIAGIYWLEQGERDEIITLDWPEQIARLTRLAAVGVRHEAIMGYALTQCVQLSQLVPVKRLRFRRSTRFWAQVLADLPAAEALL
jgi:hypothetical protein